MLIGALLLVATPFLSLCNEFAWVNLWGSCSPWRQQLDEEILSPSLLVQEVQVGDHWT